MTTKTSRLDRIDQKLLMFTKKIDQIANCVTRACQFQNTTYTSVSSNGKQLEHVNK